VKTSNNDLDFGERKLLIESLIDNIVIGKDKEVTVTLKPPIKSLGFITPSSALWGSFPVDKASFEYKIN